MAISGKWNKTKTQNLTTIGMLVAVAIVLWLLQRNVFAPMVGLKMSFMTVPVAVAAIICGPMASTILGFVFGITSLLDAVMDGAKTLTGAMLMLSIPHTVLLCILTRTLMGFCAGEIVQLIKGKQEKMPIWKYYASAVFPPLLNTLFFMGYIIVFIYQYKPVQDLVSKVGAVNPVAFVILLVGIQGLIEAGVCTVIGGTVSKAVHLAVKKG